MVTRKADQSVLNSHIDQWNRSHINQKNHTERVALIKKKVKTLLQSDHQV
jgi:hypothetical protein